MKKIRIAVVGLRHGMSHAHILEKNPRATVTALVDLDKDMLASAIEGRQATWAGFSDLGRMLEARVADAAVIAVPTAAHVQVARSCLSAGLHVLLEKPLCRTDEEAESLGDVVKASGKVFQVGYEVRSSPLHRSIMEHIRRGDLGEVTNVWWNQHTDQTKAAYKGWRALRSNMGGALFDCSPHFLDIIEQWAGAPVQRLSALGNVRGKTGPSPSDVLPESAAIALEYANGVRGTFNFGGVNVFGDDATFGVAGTTGCIRGNPNYAGSYELRAQSGRLVSQMVFDPKKTSSGHLGFSEQWEFFLDTVLEGAPNVCSFEDARQVHRMMKAIDRALTSGEEETLSLLQGNNGVPSARALAGV